MLLSLCSSPPALILSHLTVDLVLMTELGAAGSMLLKLHGDLLPISTDAKVDVPE
jgi:hypothetical protein